MAFDSVTKILASAVADAGTVNVDYPEGRGAGDYTGGYDHRVSVPGVGNYAATGGMVSFSFGASAVTITNNTGAPWPAGTTIYVAYDRAGKDVYRVANAEKMANLHPVFINLGAPDQADADGYVLSQACTASGGLATGINGALAAGADVPRNVVAAWTGTAVLTITGLDEYGKVMKESSASGTSFTGKKAFKKVTGVSVSADVTALTVGTGDVLGLPVFLSRATDVIVELEDGAAATPGTIVAGVTAKPTATTGDVRGTYDPNSAADGSAVFQLVALVEDPEYVGIAQYAG